MCSSSTLVSTNLEFFVYRVTFIVMQTEKKKKQRIIASWGLNSSFKIKNFSIFCIQYMILDDNCNELRNLKKKKKKKITGQSKCSNLFERCSTPSLESIQQDVLSICQVEQTLGRRTSRRRLFLEAILRLDNKGDAR